MYGARLSVDAISGPQVMLVVPVAIRTTEKSARLNADGLKMWTLFPSRSQRTNSLPRKPAATSRNCR